MMIAPPIRYLCWLVVCLTLLLCACSGPKRITLESDVPLSINPDDRGKPLSLVLHVYQLKSEQAFNRLTSDDLMSGKSDGDLLGNTLISSREIVVVPGSKVSVDEVIQESTQYVGLIGFFRQPDSQFWRLLYEAKPVRKHGLNFKIGKCYLEPVEPDYLPMPGQPATFRPNCNPSFR